MKVVNFDSVKKIVMKRLDYMVILSAVLVMSCSGQVTDTKQENDKKATEQTVNTEVEELKEQTAFYSDKPIHLDKAAFLDRVMNYEVNTKEWVYEGELPSLIDFYADWCAPCRITAPILDELAEEYAGQIYVYKIDIQRERELAQVFGIQGIPAFLLCPLEGTPNMFSGIAQTPQETKEMFRHYIETVLLKNTTQNL